MQNRFKLRIFLLGIYSPFIVHRLRLGKGSSAIITHSPHGGTTRRPARTEIDKTSKKWVSEKVISVMTIAEDARDYICYCPSVVHSVILVFKFNLVILDYTSTL